MNIFLIAHTDLNGWGIAQAQVVAENKSDAITEFEILYPFRLYTVVEKLNVV